MPILRRLILLPAIAAIIVWSPAKLPAADIVDRLSASATVAAPDYNHARARVQQLEKQVAQLLPASNAAEPFTAAVIRADINYRVIARKLLSAGIAAGPDGAVAVMYGHTLADNADAVQQMLGRLPALIAKVKDLNQPIEPQEIEQALELERAVERFNAGALKHSESLQSASPAHVDQYLQATLAPLAAALKISTAKEPVPTWLGAPATVDAHPPAAAAAAPSFVVEGVHLDDLARRISATPLPQATRADLLSVVEVMRRGLRQADLRPRVALFYDQLETALIVAEDLEAVNWLGPEVAVGFVDELQTAIALLQDPRTRDSAVERLDDMLHSLGVARQLSQLHDEGVPTEPLRALFLQAHQMRVANQDGRTAGAALEFIAELSALAMEYRRMLGQPMPVQFRQVLLELGGEYQKAELRLVAATPELTSNLNAIHEDKWTAALQDMGARLAQIQRVHRIPAWIEQLTAHKPRPTGGLFRQLRQLASDLTDPMKRDAAAARLSALQEQIESFDPMRFEKELASPGDAVRHATDESYTLILEQIQRLRQEWASAWASGADEGPVVQRLAQLARLLRAIELATMLGDVSAAATALNAWGAWQADPAALAPVLDALPQRVQQASRFAAIGNWPALADALSLLEHEVPIPMLVVTLHRRLSPGIERLPAGAQGVLGQTLYPPRSATLGSDQRLELAQVSVYLLEAAHARAGNSPDQARLAEQFAAQTARQILPKVR